MDHKLADLRARIDQVDRNILSLLAERQALVQRAGDLKASLDEVAAPGRVAEVLDSRRSWGQELGLDGEFCRSLYDVVVQHFVQLERSSWTTEHHCAAPGAD